MTLKDSCSIMSTMIRTPSRTIDWLRF
jgi:hypothetical protein